MNTILYLPTGSGKTYIATMLIKEMGESLNKYVDSYIFNVLKIFKNAQFIISRQMGKGRKWTFFIVQSVPLVSQQANSLRKHLPWNIGTFSGDMNVDFWSQEHWEKILFKCHVSIKI